MQCSRSLHSQQYGDPMRQKVLTWAVEDSDMEVDGGLCPWPHRSE